MFIRKRLGMKTQNIKNLQLHSVHTACISVTVVVVGGRKGVRVVFGWPVRDGGSAHIRAFAYRIIMLPIHCRSIAHLSSLSL